MPVTPVVRLISAAAARPGLSHQMFIRSTFHRAAQVQRSRTCTRTRRTSFLPSPWISLSNTTPAALFTAWVRWIVHILFYDKIDVIVIQHSDNSLRNYKHLWDVFSFPRSLLPQIWQSLKDEQMSYLYYDDIHSKSSKYPKHIRHPLHF